MKKFMKVVGWIIGIAFVITLCTLAYNAAIMWLAFSMI